MAKFKAPKKSSAKGKLKVSACYIVKNEEKNLARSIKSLKKFVEEIIVVDTGSTDGTVEVAESLGAKVFHDAWQDDFSRPRNLALENATGNWIIFLDADEYFTNLTAKNIRPVIEMTAQAKKNGLLVNLVNIDEDDGGKILDTTYVLRIFKKLPDLHYVGKIHEELRAGDSALGNMTYAPPNLLTIYHTGYSGSVNLSKAERNLKLLLEELDNTDEPQRVYGYIAECYASLGDLANAEKFARLDIAAEKSTTFASMSHRIMLRILADVPERIDDRKFFAADAVKKFPAIAEFSAELAECYAMQGEYQKAIDEMSAALQKFKSYKGVEPSTFDGELAQFAENRILIWRKRQNEEN